MHKTIRKHIKVYSKGKSSGVLELAHISSHEIMVKILGQDSCLHIIHFISDNIGILSFDENVCQKVGRMPSTWYSKCSKLIL